MRKPSRKLRENALEPHKIAIRFYRLAIEIKKKDSRSLPGRFMHANYYDTRPVVPRELIVIKLGLSSFEDQQFFFIK